MLSVALYDLLEIPIGRGIRAAQCQRPCTVKKSSTRPAICSVKCSSPIWDPEICINSDGLPIARLVSIIGPAWTSIGSNASSELATARSGMRFSEKLWKSFSGS